MKILLGLILVCLLISCTKQVKISGRVETLNKDNKAEPLRKESVKIFKEETMKSLTTSNTQLHRTNADYLTGTDESGVFQISLPKGVYYLFVYSEKPDESGTVQYKSWLEKVDAQNSDVVINLNRQNQK